MHRFFIDPITIQKEHFSSSDKELCHQVSKVLKMKPGKQIIFCDNLENELLAEWTLVSKSDCQATILQKTSKPDISRETPVHLFVPPLKNQNRFELILEKCTEIGVTSFTPLITERTEVTDLRKSERLHRIIKEAAEVSGRTLLPSLNDPVSFQEILTLNPQPLTLNLLPSLHEHSQTIAKAISLNPQHSTLNIYIGPVGDFTPEEIQQASEKGFHPVTLGSQVLRTETAAIVSAALILS